jgi:PAX-interacting protein 1
MVAHLYILFQRVHALGGELSDSVQKPTHLVAGRVTRTIKFLASMSVVKHIVTPEWLEESWRSQKFVGKCFVHTCLC